VWSAPLGKASSFPFEAFMPIEAFMSIRRPRQGFDQTMRPLKGLPRLSHPRPVSQDGSYAESCQTWRQLTALDALPLVP
jgi:hypothetical protein